MLLVAAGKPETKRQILLNTLLLVPVTFLPALLGISTAFCGAIDVGLDAVFVQHALNVRKTIQNQPQANVCVFHTILVLIFLVLLVDKGIAQSP